MLGWTMSAKDDLRLTTVVIDPGHGGNDPGAVSKDRNFHEKAYTLDISKRLAAKIQEVYPDVDVILTRSTDKTVDLADRASIANRKNAQLFISIHINAAKNTSANGFSVHVLGQSSNKNRDLFASNMDVCMRENSVIMLEEDYSTKYEGFDPTDTESYIFMTLMQSANLEQSMRFAQMVDKNLKGGPIPNDRGVWQNPFLVLWKTSMPAVLVELGFISNTDDLARLKNADNRDKIAERLFKAFKEYKSAYDGSVELNSEEKPAPAEKPAAEKPAAVEKPAAAGMPSATDSTTAQGSSGTTLYGIQIMAATKRLPDNSREFLGYTPTVIKGETFYKYIINVSDDPGTARSKIGEIRKKYPQAFLVKIEGETVTRYNQ